MTRPTFIRTLLLAAAAALLAPAARADEPHGGNHPGGIPNELYVKDGHGGYRPATPEEKLLATESPATHSADKTSFIDIKRYDLGIYTLLVFGLLYLFIQFLVWPRVAEGLKKREASIIGARDEAAKARQDAEELRAKLHKEFAEAQDKIRAMLDEARRDADALKAGEKEVGAREAQAERDRAKKEIDAELAAIREQLHQQTVQLAALMSAKAIGRQLSADDHRRLLDESLAELKNGIRA